MYGSEKVNISNAALLSRLQKKIGTSFWTTMSKIRNTGISSLYLAELINAQHKK